jgi:putative two-component system response regulator
MTAAIDAKDRYTRGHSERVGLMASKMAAAIGMDKTLVEQYRIAGLVHDVGKIGVPEGVLTKPGRLTDEEFAQIKLHPGIGYNILKDIPALSASLPGVLSHHERWDGRGYPNKISGEEIPLIARVLALADTFDAMSSNRSYRPALPRHKVLEEIARCAGSQFDPQLAPIFVKLDFTDFDAALEQHRDAEQKAA